MNKTALPKTVKNTIEKNELLDKGDHVIVGLSGGPDSVCLFSVMLELKEEYRLGLQAVHVNHMLRPGDADRDQEFVLSICRKAGVPCKAVACDCAKIAKEQGVTDEEAGRNIRYGAFYDAAKELIDKGIPADKVKIAVAQNKNDQAETMLMRIVRGTGVNGLSGIGYKRKGEHGTWVIRPLLDLGRPEIESYCKEKSLKPCIDHTNQQPVYTRNRIRLKLLPYLSANFNENIVDALARLSASAKEDNDYLWEHANAAYKSLRREAEALGGAGGTDKAVVLDRGGLKKAEPAIRHRVILAAFQEIGLDQDIAATHFSMMDQVISGGSASAEVNLPGGYVMSVSYGDAVAHLSKEHENLAEQWALIKKTLTVEEFKSESGAKSASLWAAFDYGCICAAAGDATGGVARADAESIVLRSRQQGDCFTPEGMKSGKKKIQDYFVDRKIPKTERERFRLVCLGKEAIWVLNPFSGWRGEINEKYKVTEGTKEVLLLEISSEL
ncbi:MAG: tRNA lysidine(34) synthetase TilS [Clostridiales bacterium]|nr:tRNA lysidine(34) synthetase TilS [Clostridiales bacterium]